jgi:MFS family permease
MSGLLMTPMMAGVLTTSILSGQVISRVGRYRPFPIAGTFVMVIGMLLLSLLKVRTAPGVAALYMLVLGLGMGMVMQVLVLVAQNAVDYRYLGVASSTSTLARQVGGSIGVAIFGAVFSNRLAAALPAGAHVPTAASPAVVRSLPPAIHDVYVQAVTVAMHPIFRLAAVAAAAAFALTWLLREVPLRATARVPDGKRTLEGARGDDRLVEVERALSLLARREQRWDLYGRLSARGGIDLPPPELWLLARVADREPIGRDALRAALPVDRDELAALVASLRDCGRISDGEPIVLTPLGRADHDRLVAARRDGLAQRLDGLDPAEHPELRSLLDALARDLVCAIPSPPAGDAAR